MTPPLSIWQITLHASGTVQCVMLLLLGISIVSWAFIFQRTQLYRTALNNACVFEERFWSGQDLSQLYQTLEQRTDSLEGLEKIFAAGFKEFLQQQKTSANTKNTLAAVQRAMRIAHTRESDHLTQQLSFLATAGSTSPYIGLFGTVWGIMTAFQALGNVQQASIAMVAPGISEALITTAMGLFAAIPAVIAYNRLIHRCNRLLTQYSTFQEEFINILQRQE